MAKKKVSSSQYSVSASNALNKKKKKEDEQAMQKVTSARAAESQNIRRSNSSQYSTTNRTGSSGSTSNVQTYRDRTNPAGSQTATRRNQEYLKNRAATVSNRMNNKYGANTSQKKEPTATELYQQRRNAADATSRMSEKYGVKSAATLEREKKQKQEYQEQARLQKSGLNEQNKPTEEQSKAATRAARNTPKLMGKALMDTGSGYLQTLDDVTEMTASSENGTQAMGMKLGIQDDADQMEKLKQSRKETVEAAREDRLKRAAAQEARQKEWDELTKDAGGLERAYYGAVESGTGMLADIGIGALTGTGQVGSLASMAARTYGSTRGQAEKEGATESEDRLYSLLQAGKEVGSELMFPGAGLAKRAYGRAGLGAADTAAKILTRNLTGKKADVVNAGIRLLGGTAEENLEEAAGWGLDPLIKEYTYGRNVRQRDAKSTMKAISDDLRSNIQTEDDALAASAFLASDDFMEQTVEEYMATGLSREEATDVAEKMRDYLAAGLTGDTGTMVKLEDDVSKQIAKYGGLTLKDWDLKELGDTLASTSLLTLTTGMPGTVKTSQRGAAIRDELGSEGVKALAKTAIGFEDPEAHAKAEAMSERLEAGKELTSTQVYDLAVAQDQQVQKNIERQAVQVRSAITRMQDDRLTGIYQQDEDGNVTLREATQAAVDESKARSTEILNRINDENKSLSEADIDRGATAIANFEAGTFTVGDADQLNYNASPEVRQAFSEKTGINLNQYVVMGADGKVDIPATNAATKDALFAYAADNMVKSARIETEKFINETRGRLDADVMPRLGAEGQAVWQGISKELDPRDGAEYLRSANAAVMMYAAGRNTSMQEAEVKKLYGKTFRSVDEAILTKAFDAGRQDQNAANEVARGQSAKIGESIANTDREPIITGTLTIDPEAAGLVTGEALDLYRSLAAATSTNIRIVSHMDILDNEGNPVVNKKTGRPLQINGQSVGNEIWLNVNADAEANLGYVFMHEMTHQIKNYAPEEYQKLENLIRDKWYRNDATGMQADIANKIRLYKIAGQDLSEEKAMEEIVADAMAEAMDDPDFATRVCEEDVSTGKAVLNAIRSALRSLRSMLAGNEYRNERFHGALLSQLGILSEAEAIWLNALDQARRNKAQMGIEQWDGSNSYSVVVQPHHTTEQIRIINEYNSSVNEDVLNMIKDVRSGNKFKPVVVGEVTTKMASDLMSALPSGIYRESFNPVGYKIVVSDDYVEHTDKKHGKNGKSDHSMGDDNDMARIGYVINNYDVFARQGKSTKYKMIDRNGKTVPAPTIGFEKTIDGTVCGGIAVPDTNAKELVIVSAYINKKKVFQMPDANAPGSTAKTDSESPSDINIPQTSAEGKGSLSISDTDYLSAVESGDMETAQRMVDEAAKAAMPGTKLKGKWYHGTENDFNVFDFSQGGKNGTAEGFGIYLAQNQEITRVYGDRQIAGYVNMERPASSDKRTIKRAELIKLIKATVENEAKSLADDYGGDLNAARRDTWISNYTYTYDKSVAASIAEVADSILQMNDNDMDIVQEVMAGMAIRDYEKASAFYNLLTETTGIDGFTTVWENSETNEQNRIALAFRSEQIKSADPVTYDDNGDVIPLSKRFDTSNPDVRFSISSDDRAELNEAGIDVTDGGSAIRYSVSSWEDTDIEALVSKLVEAGYEEAAARRWVEGINSIAAIIYGDRTRLDYSADEYQDALKANSEYYYTLDLSTLCQKRRLYQGTYNAIMHRLVDRALMPEDTVRLRALMDELGYEVPCGICYEESRKKNEGKFAKRWLEGYGKKWKGYKNQTHDDPYIPTLDEVTTTDGRERLRKEHPEAYESYINYQKTRGSANPKVSFTHTDYRGDILKLTDSEIEKLMHIGGLRIQSFSDFETVHVIDMMQAVMDMAARKLTSQAYTKVPAFADIFGGTGIKINLSLIGKVDESGKLQFDAKEGIDPEEAFRLRKKYSKNVGTIIVGADDASILAAWADPRIDMVIPFRRSGWSKAEFDKLGLAGYKDFTKGQTERYLMNGKDMALSTASKELGLTGDDKLEGIYSSDYWDYDKSGKENAEAYLKLCAEKHYRPVFYQFLRDNGDGTWSLQEDGSTDGYWKSLIDYKMYDNEGKKAPQELVQPNFDMEAAQKTMDAFEGDPDTLPVAWDVVDKFADKYGEKRESTSDQVEKSKTNFNISAENIDTRRYSTVKLTKREYAIVASSVASKNASIGNVDQHMIDFTFTDNLFVLYETTGDNDFRPFLKFKIDGNEDVIRRIRDEFNQEASDLDPIVKSLRNRRGRSSSNTPNASRRGQYSINDRLDRQESERNEIRNSPSSSGDFKLSISPVDSEGMKLSPGQAHYFRDSKAVDEDGRLMRFYHSTDRGGFTTFDPAFSHDHRSLFFTSSLPVSATYTRVGYEDVEPIDLEDQSEQSGYYDCYLNLVNPMIIDAEGSEWVAVPFRDEVYTTGEIAEIAFEEGYDGVIIRNVEDIGDESDLPLAAEPLSDIAIAFSSNQVKSVDNLNPTTDPDIRYSFNLQQENEILSWLAEYGDMDSLPMEDPREEAGRIRMIQAMYDFFEDKDSKWDETKLTMGRVLDHRKTEKSIRNIIMAAMSESNTDAKYRKAMVDYAVTEAKRAFSDLKTGHLEDAYQVLWRCAEEICGGAEFFHDDTDYERYKEIRQYFRTVKLAVPERYKSDIDYAAYRKKNFGRMRLVTEGREDISIDDMWTEVTTMWPDLVSEEARNDDNISIPDILEAIDEGLDRCMRPYLIAYTSEEAADVIHQLADDLYNVVTGAKAYESVADIVASDRGFDQKLRALKQRHEEAMRAVQTGAEARIREIQQQAQADVAAARAEQRAEDEAEMERAVSRARSEEQAYAKAQAEKAAEKAARDLEQSEEARRKEQEKTEKQRQRAEMWKERTAEAKRTGSERVRNVRQDYKRKLKEQEVQHAWDIAGMKDRQKFREAYIRNEARKKAKAADEKRAEHRERVKRFGRIGKNYDWLTQRLMQPTDDKHIPEQFRKALAAFLCDLDLQTERSKNLEEKYGTVAQKTIRMRALRDRLAEISKEDGSGIFEHDPEFDELVKALTDRIAGEPIDMLDTYDLIAIDRMLRELRHFFTNYDKIRIEGKKVQIAEYGNALMDFLYKSSDRREFGGLVGMADKILNMSELTPRYAFKRMGPLFDMYKEIRRGFDKYIRNQKFLMDEMDRICGTYKNKKKQGSTLEDWRSTAMQQTFNLTNGSVTMSVAQMMSLYCLAKRPQAAGHMLGDGITVSPIQASSKIEKAKEDTLGKTHKAESVVLTWADIQTIVAELGKTEGAIEMADQFQQLMAGSMADWGNECSMEMFGYKKFRDENYFPIRVDGRVKYKDVNNMQEMYEKIKNFSATKEVVPHARNVIVIDDIFSVVAEHCNNMNLYNAFSLPISDFMRVYNYRQYTELENGATKATTVQQMIEQKYGKLAITYIDNFMRDINGMTSHKRGGLEDVLNAALGHAKKAAVFLNMRVALQQPTAIVRAAAVLPTKHLVHALKAPDKQNLLSDVKEMQEHCPIALWKSWGFYDTYMGRNIEDLMMNTNWSRWETIATGVYGALDNLTWGLIWRAVKYDVRAAHPNVEAGSDEFFRLCSERATEVFDETQVVDSIFHRSDAMRSKDLFVKSMTSFQSEPTLTYNVVRAGIVEAVDLAMDGDIAQAAAKLARTLSVYVVQAAVVSATAALWDAVRRKGADDDDEDRTGWDFYLELWWLNNKSNFMDNVNMCNNIYIVKDVMPFVEMIHNHEYNNFAASNNLMMQGFQTLTKGITQAQKKMEKGDDYDKSWIDISENILGGIGYLTGYPVKTGIRDLRALWKWSGLKMPVFADDGTITEIVGSDTKPESSSAESTGTKSGKGSSTKTGSGSAGSSEEESSETKAVDYEALELKAFKKAEGLSGAERSRMIWDTVSDGYTKYIEDGDWKHIEKIREIYVNAGGTPATFDSKVLDQCKTALKKSIYSDSDMDWEKRKKLLDTKRYMLEHGMTAEEVSELAYKTYTARDLKAAMRMGNKEYIMDELVPLIMAGLSYEDYQKLYQYRNYGAKTYDGKYSDPKYRASTGSYVWPASGPITSGYGGRSAPTAGASTYHEGIDIGASYGDPVNAADGGVVTFVGYDGAAGNRVIVQHDDGTETLYSHLSGFSVNVGDQVAQGQQLGQVGSTGVSTGPHLDFRMRVNGTLVNPMEYLAS